jgi:hypothetical protein
VPIAPAYNPLALSERARKLRPAPAARHPHKDSNEHQTPCDYPWVPSRTE